MRYFSGLSEQENSRSSENLDPHHRSRLAICPIMADAGVEPLSPPREILSQILAGFHFHLRLLR